jgi:hypothetical protein
MKPQAGGKTQTRAVKPQRLRVGIVRGFCAGMGAWLVPENEQPISRAAESGRTSARMIPAIDQPPACRFQINATNRNG